MLVFETSRLRCRRWIKSDFDPLYAVYSDSDAMRWVDDGQPITRAECERWFEVTHTNYRLRGYGMFALEDRESGEVVGFCGLVHPGGQVEAEIKYALRRSRWGAGLASEAVPALLSYGAQEHGLTRIIATVAPDNIASQRVLAKAGMRLAQRRTNDDGTTTLVFAWSAHGEVFPANPAAHER
jgi:ribosomal-protein-alanine N-acetyltransferase